MPNPLPAIWTGPLRKCAFHPRAICLTRSRPAFCPKTLANYPPLAPAACADGLPFAAFFPLYRDQLQALDPHKVLADLAGKVLIAGDEPPNWCHRHMVAAWLYKHTGAIIREWNHRGPFLIAPGIHWSPNHPTS